MSSEDAAAADLATLFDTLYTGSYCSLAASALTTIDREAACFWQSKPTGASLLFFANKWISVAVYVMALVAFVSFPTDENCSSFTRAIAAVTVLQFIPGAAFSALRAYVLSKSRFLGVLVFAFSIVPVGVNLVPFGYHLTGVDYPPFGCLATDKVSTTTNLQLIAIISRVSLIISDILLIYVTATKLSSRELARGIRHHKRLSFSDILLRDGIIYFIVLFILNSFHIIFSVTAVAVNLNDSEMTIFTGPVTAVLISRFLLELQEANQTVIRLDADDPLHFSNNPYDDTPSFIRSLGAVIDLDLHAPRNDGPESELMSHSDLGMEGGSKTQAPQAADSSSVSGL